MDEGLVRFGEGADQFHHNEAISAVADEGFLGEEDEDYEDLYNDVNVGEGFLQSLRKGEELDLRNEEEKKIESLPRAAADQDAVSIRGVGEGSGNGGVGDVGEVRLSGFQSDQGFRVNVVKGTVGSGSGGIRVELGQGGITSKMNEVEEGNNITSGVQGIVGGQQSRGGGAVNVGSVGNGALVRHTGGGNVNGIGGDGVADSGGSGVGVGRGSGVGVGGGGGAGFCVTDQNL